MRITFSGLVAVCCLHVIGANSGPTWIYFGEVLGVNLGLSWYQIPLKIGFEINQKIDHLFDRLKIDFWLQHGPQEGFQIAP